MSHSTPKYDKGGGFRREAPKEFAERIRKEKEDTRQLEEELDVKFGFERRLDPTPQLGWLLSMYESSIRDEDTKLEHNAIDLYFLCEDGSTFKATKRFEPYFYLGFKDGIETKDIEAWLLRRFEGLIFFCEPMYKEDLDLKNHLSGMKRLYLKLSFRTNSDLLSVRRTLLPLVKANVSRTKDSRGFKSTFHHDANGFMGLPTTIGNQNQSSSHDIESTTNLGTSSLSSHRTQQDLAENIVEIREYDVTYHQRIAIDLGYRVGKWYTVMADSGGLVDLEERKDLVEFGEPRVLAFDIETTKAPLKFPVASVDQIMMISYMLDSQGYLIVNREIVSQDIDDFEYTPKPGYEGPFIVMNELDELSVLQCFFRHIQEVRPHIYVTYNGDFFDWPFIDARAKHHGLSLFKETGICFNESTKEYNSRFAVHLDAFCWVKRDSYLPQGSQGLKAVTKTKLGYDPLELDPELMTPYAIEQPQVLASYSVSDAVSTYYLYRKYVHGFIYSLCSIIPMNPSEVLRKGSGTLCESLLMVQAFVANVICPNKHVADAFSTYDGHLLESETYVGAAVECLESGVFRSDLPTKFRLVPSAFQELIDSLDEVLEFAIEIEGGIKRSDIVNYDQVRDAILNKLETLRDTPKRIEKPLIYHLDVAAMYPNIILSNRLQPSAVVTPDVCAACDFNSPENLCQRNMKWQWRGDYSPASRAEYELVRGQVEYETFASGKKPSYQSKDTRDAMNSNIRKRLKEYCARVYKKSHVLETQLRESTVCMRENAFYVDTVRDFRDRRYDYKIQLKVWKGKLDAALGDGNVQKIKEAQNMIIVFDSLQLAHKCILNSFYGYVMRKGARWYSMEMAGIVCHTGSSIIKMAQKLVEQIGRPLELDTDGIWCVLPHSFPENFVFKTNLPKRSSYTMSYPCSVLNHRTHKEFTNHQYQSKGTNGQYTIQSENSIFFEVDGPYRAMILPAAKEEGKLLKKRYVVFNDDGTLAELKGFELKRRGELKLIKIFQSQIFDCFLEGDTLAACYESVAHVANRWLDVLDSKGIELSDEDLIDLIAESRNMSNTLAEYGAQKSTAICTAKRIAEFLGDQMVKDKGLACNFVLSQKPHGAPISSRAIPVAIFSADEDVMRHYVRRWCGDPTMSNFDIRDILDWNYYRERLSSAIQKIISIPAALQRIPNPVPRVEQPEWLIRAIRLRQEAHLQPRLMDIAQFKENTISNDDIEAIGDVGKRTAAAIATVQKKQKSILPDEESLASRDEDFPAWLDVMKRRWKHRVATRIETRRKLQSGELVSDPRRKPIGGAIAQFVTQKSSATLANAKWQILEVSSTNAPGILQVWVLLGQDNMQRVELHVPRHVYLNSRIEDTQFDNKTVAKILPRSRHSIHLYEMSIPEAQFIENTKEVHDLLTDADVEGVYESQVHPVLRTCIELGALATVKPNARYASQRPLHVFEMNQLSAVSKGSRYYLDSISLSRWYLFYCQFDTRGIIFMIAPNIGQISIALVNPYSQVHDLKVSALQKEFPDVTSNTTIDLQVFTSFTQAHKHTQSFFVKHHVGQALTVLVTQSTASRSALCHAMPAASTLPHITMPFHASDKQVPALGWQLPAAQRALNRYMLMEPWWSEQLSYARYANLPIGNLMNAHAVGFIADIAFSRLLRQSNHILWLSSGPFPDLGGISEDFRTISESSRINATNLPGVYRSFCIEFDLFHLAVNAVLQSTFIEALGGASTHTFELASSTHAHSAMPFEDIDVVASCSPVFLILKNLLGNWSLDVAKSGNTVADALLVHFYRWIRSPQSLSFDPALHLYVHRLMRTSFQYLCSELSSINGITIIHADQEHVLIATGKQTFSGVEAFCQYLTEKLKQDEILRWIQLAPRKYWQHLVYLDTANYAGVEIYSEDSGIARKMASQWNIAEFLPSRAKDMFQVILSEFIYLPLKTILDGSNQGEEIEDVLSGLISNHFSKKLFTFANELVYHSAHVSFPRPAGHHIQLESVAKTFIIYACHILGLDSMVKPEVNTLKRSLFRQVGLREFDSKSEFVNPCRTFYMHDVVCDYCYSCTVLDLCRDTNVVSKTWQCSYCGQPYDLKFIERQLIHQLQRAVLAFQMQDLRCIVCRRIADTNASQYCPCGGKLDTVQSTSHLLDGIRVLQDVAKWQEFEWLESEASLFLNSRE